MKNTLYLLTAAFFLFACQSAPKEEVKEVVEEVVTEEVVPEMTLNSIDMVMEAKGNSNVIAKVNFYQENGRVYMTASLENLTQGKHGIHLHENGDCSAEDGSSAGGHWNPTGEAHGKWGVPPFHRGDIGNFEADKDGKAIFNFDTDLWCIGCGDANMDILGKSVIIHAGEDDCTSQPSGNAGARVACAAIAKNY